MEKKAKSTKTKRATRDLSAKKTATIKGGSIKYSA
jgi:hypothetical protein